jgi:hypothetical protein
VFVIYFEMSNLFISNTNKLFPKTLHTYIFNPLFQYLFVQFLRFFNSKHFIKKSIKCSSFLCLFTHCNCPFILFLSIHKSLKSGILLLDIISYLQRKFQSIIIQNINTCEELWSRNEQNATMLTNSVDWVIVV